jgi:glutamate racemase
VYEHATPELVPLVEAGKVDGAETRAAVRRSLEPLLGSGGRDGEFVFPLPRTGRIDTLLLGCTHYPLLAPLIVDEAGPDIAVIDSAPATASALAELLAVNDLAAPGGNTAEHRQLTTGDVDAFRRTAERLFGDVFPSVAAVGVVGAA